MEPETKPPDVLTIGEMVVDFISAERTDTLSNASTCSSGIVVVSDNGNVERAGLFPKVRIENVTGTRDAFWSALRMAHLGGKDWPLAVSFAHEVASLKLGARATWSA